MTTGASNFEQSGGIPIPNPYNYGIYDLYCFTMLHNVSRTIYANLTSLQLQLYLFRPL